MKNLLSFFLGMFLFLQLSAQTIKTFGDSNSDENFANEDKWSEIIRKKTNYNVLSYAAAGATLSGVQRQIAYAESMNAGPKDIAVMMVGTNDALNLTIDAAWKADYKQIVQTGLINAGYNANKIILIAPSEATQATGDYATKMSQVHQYVKEVASELGTQFIDLYDEAYFIVKRSKPLTVYNMAANGIGDEVHLSGTGQALLAYMVMEKIKKFPNKISGDARVKIWGAGSAMAGQSSYHSHFVQLFAEQTGRTYENYSVAGTGLGSAATGPDEFYYTRQHANDGVKDIAIFLYGNNDGSGDPSWIATYEKYITESFINNGYQKKNLVLMTATRAGNLSTQNPGDFTRIGAANDNIRLAAQRLGITLLDIEKEVPKTMYSDAYHLSDDGMQYVANMLEQAFLDVTPNPLPIKANSLKITWVSPHTFKATFIASQTTNTERFRLMYSEDGINFKEAYSLVPEKLEAEKQYTFTFKTNN
jgi:lysophospholipase L1-like esterase